MKGNPFVGIARVGWMEFFTHLRSSRLLVLAILFALVVLGSAYGISRISSTPPGNQTQVYVHAALVNESGMVRYVAIAYVCDFYGAPKSGEAVDLYRITFGGGPPATEELLAKLTTNDSGFVRYDIGATQPDKNESYQFRLEALGYVNTLFFDPDLMNRTLSISWGGGYGYSSGFASDFVMTLHILNLDGTPATAADISLNDTVVGHPDEHGFFALHVPQGDFTVRVSYQGYEESRPVSNQFSSGPAWSNGADAIIGFMGLFLMPLFLPIVAIAISFDVVARERAQGSLELLLCRRVSRIGILAGKFVGTFTSVAVPVVAVLLAGIGMITAVSGQAPTASLAAAFVGSTLFLIAVYILLMLALSTVAKSVGTAVVFGVVAWLLFNVLFNFLVFLVLIATGGDLFSRAFFETFALILLANPNAVYQFLMSLSLPTSGTGSFGLIPVGYLAPGVIVGAAVAWLLGLFVLAAFLFQQKAEG